ncbi:portal protein [uncultured Salipiger sp.]|uniref:portal protein n=1 Tax=uncultured Salipiger sp. TaxID=499810 RepID=UPI00259723E1|nr:portal protein [uncultured Salipiger sp.]
MKHEVGFPNDARAIEAARRWQELREPRQQMEGDWNDIARLIRPQRGGFGLDTATTREFTKTLSSDGAIAHGNFAAGIYAGITNPATRWGGLGTPDDELNRWPPFAEWLDGAAARVHRTFSPSMSSFYPASYQAYADISAFGNAAGYDEIDQGSRRFIDVTFSLAEIVVDIDFHGRVVEAVRKRHLTPRQAVRAFGSSVPERIADLAETGSTEKHAYYQHVMPNDQFVARGLGPRGKRWLSIWCCEHENTVVRVGGFDEMPIYFPRWDVDSGMCYGTGPGFIALGSARKLDLMEAATMRAAQRAADPTKLAPDRNAVPLNGEFRPGKVVYGAITMQGQRLVQSEDFNGNIGLTMEEKRAAAETVRDAFYYSVMSLTGRTGISDDENRVIEEARLRNWAPHADRIMEEYAARKYERRFRMLWRAGQIPPPPEGIPEGTPLEVRYTSAAAMALRASEASATRQLILGDLMPLAQVRPEILDRISVDDYAEVLHEASPAIPQRVLVSREDAEANRQARAQAQQAQAMAEMAKTGGAGLRDMAQAGALMQGGGQE